MQIWIAHIHKINKVTTLSTAKPSSAQMSPTTIAIGLHILTSFTHTFIIASPRALASQVGHNEDIAAHPFEDEGYIILGLKHKQGPMIDLKNSIGLRTTQIESGTGL